MAHTGPLSQMFLAHLREGIPGILIPADLEGCLEQLLVRCHAAWPGLDVPVPIFLRHLATLLSGGDETAPSLAALHAEDLYLACACAYGIAPSHSLFDSVCLTQVPAWLAGKTPKGALSALAEEVQQILREQLLVTGKQSKHGLPRIARYGGRGKLLSWVRVACLRVAADLRRSGDEQHTEARDPGTLDFAVGEVHPELEWMKAHYRQEFADAFRAALLSLPGDQRNLLRLHLVEGLSIDKLGPLYHLSRATMARRLQAARQAILDKTEQLLKERLGVTAGQARSLAYLLRSQLDISLFSLLTQEAPGR